MLLLAVCQGPQPHEDETHMHGFQDLQYACHATQLVSGVG